MTCANRFLLALLLLITSGRSFASDSDDDVADVDHIAAATAAWIRSQKLFNRFWIVYSEDTFNTREVATAAEVLGHTSYLISLATDGRRRYWYRQTIADELGPIKDHDFTRFSFDGERFYAWKKHRRTANEYIDKKDALQQKSWFKNYLLATAVWPFEGYPTDAREHFLPFALRERHYTAERVKKVSGYDCVEFARDDGRDTIWCAPELNYAVVRRCWLTPQDFKGLTYVNEVECSAFRQVERGVWLPYRVWRHNSTISERRSASDSVSVIAIGQLSLTHVHDEVFRPRYLPGTEVYDLSARKGWSIPGGEDALDAKVRDLSQEFTIVPAYTSPPLPFFAACGTVLALQFVIATWLARF